MTEDEYYQLVTGGLVNSIGAAPPTGWWETPEQEMQRIFGTTDPMSILSMMMSDASYQASTGQPVTGLGIGEFNTSNIGLSNNSSGGGGNLAAMAGDAGKGGAAQIAGPATLSTSGDSTISDKASDALDWMGNNKVATGLGIAAGLATGNPAIGVTVADKSSGLIDKASEWLSNLFKTDSKFPLYGTEAEQKQYLYNNLASSGLVNPSDSSTLTSVTNDWWNSAIGTPYPTNIGDKGILTGNTGLGENGGNGVSAIGSTPIVNTGIGTVEGGGGGGTPTVTPTTPTTPTTPISGPAVGELPQFRKQLNRALGEAKNAAIMRGTPLTENDISGAVAGLAEGAYGRLRGAESAQNEKERLQILKDQVATSKDQWEKGFISDNEYRNKVLELEKYYADKGLEIDMDLIDQQDKNATTGNILGAAYLLSDLFWG